MNKYWLLILLFFCGLILSAIHPHDYFTWFLEVFPAIVGFIILTLTFSKFRFTYLTYIFILIHCYILFIGGKYTYALVPLFDWIRETFHQSRNNYDKVGHFAQGFIPALIAREYFIRKAIVSRGFWLPVLTICVCLSISVLYELSEWLVAIISGQSAEAFLGTQGYIWDTQSDMFWALTGATCMILFMSRLQDKSIARMSS